MRHAALLQQLGAQIAQHCIHVAGRLYFEQSSQKSRTSSAGIQDELNRASMSSRLQVRGLHSSIFTFGGLLRLFQIQSDAPAAFFWCDRLTGVDVVAQEILD